MPLSLTSEFSENDIISIRVYKEGKVYLLQGNGQDIVIKQEDIKAANATHFDLSKKAMGVIDKNVKASKKLSENEVQALARYVIKQKALVHFQMKDRLPGATSDLDQALANLRDASLRQVWFKMPHTPMDNLQSALEAKHGMTLYSFDKDSEACEQSDKPMRTFLKTLKGSGGLESLGKIIAIDMFSGNGDRVVPGAFRKETIAGYSYRFNAIQNIGNLLITGSGKAKTLTGMDFADPNSVLLEADKALDVQTQRGEWLGDHITDPAKRKTFAIAIIGDLEQLFTLGKKKTLRDRLPGDKTALGGNAVKRLEAGMVSGAHMLAKSILDKIAQKNKQYPPSYAERATRYRAVV